MCDVRLLLTVAQEQAQLTGDELRDAGFFATPCDLVVVSPFTRTLETAIHILGAYVDTVMCTRGLFHYFIFFCYH